MEIISAIEKADGTCTFNPSALRAEQGRSQSSATAYARVMFQGTYNQVMGDYTNASVGTV